jgi:hypothetical protein
VSQAFELADFARAFDLIGSRGATGKLVLTL